MDKMKALTRLLEEARRLKTVPNEEARRAGVSSIINKLLVISEPPNSSGKRV